MLPGSNGRSGWVAASFSQALDAWVPYFAAVAGVAATLLGLLFVSVSLRLNLFREAGVADVRDFAALVFGQYLAVVVLGLTALFPDTRPATLGVPALLLGALGIGWGLHTGRQYLRLNRAPGTRRPWSLAACGIHLAAASALIAAAGWLLVRRDSEPLPWLAGTELVLLVAASAGAWVLLSHAQAS